MNKIGDDELGQILSRVTNPDDRKSASEVCKAWWVMEGLSRSSLRVYDLGHLPRLLARYPNLTTLKTPMSMSNADLVLVFQSCPKLEVFILNYIATVEELKPGFGSVLDELGKSLDELRKKLVYQVGDEGLRALAVGCPNLSKIVLRWNGIGLLGIMALITPAAHNLTHLDLEGCAFDLDQALEAIGSSNCSLGILNLNSCRVTVAGLRFLANGSCSKTIKQLNLANIFGISDDGASLLSKMCVLEELDLAYCVNITDIGGQAISTIRTLKKLNLSCLHLLTEKTFVSLAKNCIYLEDLNLHHCEVTAASIDAFVGHKCLRSFNLFCCGDFKGSTLESLAVGCPSLELIVVQERWRGRLLQEMQESTVSRFLKFLS